MKEVGFETFLNDMRHLELVQDYEEIIARQNQDADPDLIRQTAEKAAELLGPLDDAVMLSQLPYFQVSTEINGLSVEIHKEGEE